MSIACLKEVLSFARKCQPSKGEYEALSEFLASLLHRQEQHIPPAFCKSVALHAVNPGLKCLPYRWHLLGGSWCHLPAQDTRAGSIVKYSEV